MTCKRIWNSTYFSEIIIDFNIDRVQRIGSWKYIKNFLNFNKIFFNILLFHSIEKIPLHLACFPGAVSTISTYVSQEKGYCIAYNSLVCTANVLSRAFHRIQPPHVVGSSSLQKYSTRLQEGGEVPHQIPLQAMSNESKQRNVQVQPCKGGICSNIISMNMGSNSADHAEVTNLSQAILLYGKKIMAEIAWKEYPFLVRV